MAKLRKFVAYRRLERPYTRKSKFKKKSYIKAVPQLKITRFDMGNTTAVFDYTLNLVSGSDLQIRHNALEAARQVSNRIMETTVGKNDYFFKVAVYPHHVLRENPLASGAGADRMSTGMQMAFGKPIGIAAQIRKGKRIFMLQVNKDKITIARKALAAANTKLPCTCHIVVVETKKKKPSKAPTPKTVKAKAVAE